MHQRRWRLDGTVIKVVQCARDVDCSISSCTPIDTQTAYLRSVLTFLGMSNVEFVFAEGLALAPAANEQAVTKASAQAEAPALPALAASA
jgi:hypothetical protein